MRRILTLTAAAMLAWQACYADQVAEGPPPKPLVDHAVQIVESKHARAVTFVAHLTNCTDATITLDVTLKNMTASRPLPSTVNVRGANRLSC